MKDIEFNLTIDEVKQLETDNEQNFKTDIELIRERKRLLKEQQDKEEQREQDLIKQENERILNIQNDIKVKFDNNELNLTEEQKREIQHKKQNTKIIIQTEEKKYLNLKEYWESFKIWKIERFKEKTGKEYSRSSMNNINSSYKYLLEFINKDENFNICDFTPRFFVELQEEFKKIPTDFNKKIEFKQMTLKEIIEENKIKKYSVIRNKYINDMFDIYSEFFKFLNTKFIFENDMFKNYIKLVKQQTENEYQRFTEEEIKLLFNNNLKKKDKTTIKDFLKIGFYSGMRIGELSELRTKDIIEIDGIYCFNICEDLENGKRLKNKNSVRIVPIHSEILEMVLNRVKNSENDFLIFDGDKVSNNDRINKYYIRKLIQNDLSKVFHSTRKNFSYELYKHSENDLINQYLMGHGESLNSMSVYYSNKEIGTIQKRKEVIELLKYDI